MIHKSACSRCRGPSQCTEKTSVAIHTKREIAFTAAQVHSLFLSGTNRGCSVVESDETHGSPGRFRESVASHPPSVDKYDLWRKFQCFLLNVQLMWRWCLPVDMRLRKYLCRMFREGVLNIMMLKPLSHRGLAELENSRTDSPGSLLPVASNCARRGRLNTHCYPLLSEITF